jgi:type I restriction enzyme, S subunit
MALKWPTKPLGELAEFRNGANYNKSSFGKGVKVVGVKDFKDYTKPKFDELEQINPEGVVTDRNILRDGDIVFVRSNGNRELIGRSLLISKPPEQVTHSAFTIRLRFTSQDVCSQYYAYLFRTPLIRKELTAFGGGTNISNLNQDILNQLRVQVPPLTAQQHIASILSAYDDLIENNLRRIAILEEMARRIYEEWFVHFRFPGHEKVGTVESELGLIPEGWEVKRLDEIVVFQNNGTVAGEHLRERVYLPIDCIPRKSLAIRETNSWIEAKSSLHLFDEGDILFGAMRPYFHKVVVAPFKGVTRKTCFIFKSTLPEYHAFAAFTLFQDSTVSFATAHSKGATIPYAVWPQSMDCMPVVVPSIEQVKKFENAVGPMIDRIGTMFFQNTNLRTTRDLLIPKLISGEIDVSEINEVSERADAA